MVAAVFEIAAALFGACIGSFLNVVIWRLPQEDPQKRSLGGRSHCPACGAAIAAFDNVPVFAWLWLRGRARCCGAKISIRYPTVELLTGVLFYFLAVAPPIGVPAVTSAGTVDAVGMAGFVAHATFVSLLVALSYIDFDTQLLLNVLTKPGMVLGLLFGIWPGVAGALPVSAPVAMQHALASLLGLLVGGGITWGVRILGASVFKKEAMGFGDVKLMAMIGAFVGWQGALLSLFLGCVFGSIVGGLMALRSATAGDTGVGARIPFGPYLAMGATTTMFFGERLLRLLLVDWPRWQERNPSSMLLVLTIGIGALLALLWLVRRARRSG